MWAIEALISGPSPGLCLMGSMTNQYGTEFWVGTELGGRVLLIYLPIGKAELVGVLLILLNIFFVGLVLSYKLPSQL